MSPVLGTSGAVEGNWLGLGGLDNFVTLKAGRKPGLLIGSISPQGAVRATRRG